MMKWLAAAAALMIGCVTPYGPMGLTGGYSEMRVSETMFRVTARGNGVTAQERVIGILHLRCAELTLANGYEFFEVLGSDSQVHTATMTVGQGRTQGTMTPRFGGGVNYSETYTPPQQIGVNRYEAVALIRLGKGTPRPEYAFDAQEVVKFLRPSLAP